MKEQTKSRRSFELAQWWGKRLDLVELHGNQGPDSSKHCASKAGISRGCEPGPSSLGNAITGWCFHLIYNNLYTLFEPFLGKIDYPS